MDEASLYRLLAELQDGSVSADDVVRRLRRLPYADLGFARVDHHRALRQGLPEAVYGPGKSVDHCVDIVGELLAEPDGGPVILSRASAEQSAAVLAASSRRRSFRVDGVLAPSRPTARTGGRFCRRHRRPELWRRKARRR